MITIYGTNQADFITGSATQDEKIFALGGDDDVSGDPYYVFGSGVLSSDIIFGGKGRDYICGDALDIYEGQRGGNDKLYGEGDDDTVIGDGAFDGIYEGGQGGDDVLDGGDGNDGLSGDGAYFIDDGGTGGNDLLIGGRGDDDLTGDADYFFSGEFFTTTRGGDDRLDGGDGNDLLRGDGVEYRYPEYDVGEILAGNDFLEGGRGNDVLFGDFVVRNYLTQDGKDTLIGVEARDCKPGKGEIDTLTGGGNSDLFILGDREKVFYDDSLRSVRGVNDYALITDFSLEEGDTIQLYGKGQKYFLGASPLGSSSDTAIFLTQHRCAPELIGVIQGIAPYELSLDSPAFCFV